MNIKDARAASGLTQRAMCDLMLIPIRTIQDWESGRRTPPEWAERLIVAELKRIQEVNKHE